MARRALKVCSVAGCPELTEQGKCTDHRRQADRARGTTTERGYSSRGHRRFRAAVLARDLWCQLCSIAASTVADHYPKSRRELVEQGLDPNDPAAGRGLCASCHGKATAADPAQRGGWNRR